MEEESIKSEYSLFNVGGYEENSIYERNDYVYSKKDVEKIKEEVKTATYNKCMKFTAFIAIFIALIAIIGIQLIARMLPQEPSELKYLQVLKLYSENYVNDVDMEKLVDDSIGGILLGMGDKYGFYIPSKNSQVTGGQIMNGNYSGVGITYNSSTVNEGYIVIEDIIEDSPAGRSKIKKGDKVTKINGKSVTIETVQQFLEDIEKKRLKTVDLEINYSESILIQLGAVKLPKLEYSAIGDIGYLKIYTFVEETLPLFKNAIDDLKNKGINQIVFDVRDNHGGDAEVVIQMLDYILPEGDIVTLKYKNKEREEKVYKSDSFAALGDIKMSILANGMSASASELFIMTLQDNANATLIGQTTYGKSTILSLYNFKDGSILAMSTGYYYPKSERFIEGLGIKPDKILEDSEINMTISELIDNGKIK